MLSSDLKPLRVLIIEDSEDDADLLLIELARSRYACEHHRVQTEAELKEALSSGPWDIILSDHSMPSFNAPEALRIVQTAGSDIPFVVVSGSIGDEQAVAVMKAGAHDYIMKDNLSRLAPVVERELRETRERAMRRRAEKALRENEEVFRALSDSSPLGVYLADREGRVTYVNPRACEIFQIPQAQALGNTWLQRLSPEDRPKAWANWQAYVSRGSAGEFTAEHRLRFAEIPDRWIRTRVSPVRSESSLTGFVGTVEDVTQQKTAEIALLESEEYNRRLVQEARDVIFSVGPDATFKALNPAFEAISGWDLSDWLGKPFPPLLHPEDVPLAMAKLQTVLGGGKPGSFELRVRHKDGHFLSFEFTATPRTHGGAVVGISGIARDVTERKRLEEQLQQAQKVEAIGSLAGGIAHDFNNILSVILGYGDLAMSQLAREKPAYDAVQEMTKAAERAASLTRQLLAFSRKQTLQPEVLDLNRTILDLRSMLRRLIGEHLDFQVELDERLPPARADLSQIEQTIMNLVINARDALQGSGSITLRTACASLDGRGSHGRVDLPPGDYAAFSVVDDGTGMPPEVKARLFEPFFTTKPEGQGTGLGLSTVFGIVKQSGGDIAVESEPGNGSTFTVYLPAVEGAFSAPDQRPEPLGDLRGNETILVAEDEKPLRVLATTVLRHYGYTVLEAGDGEEALQAARSHDSPVSLVVTDVAMPKMGGRELAEKMADEGYGGGFLFVSGYAGGTLVEQGVTPEKVTFLQKPFTPTALVRKVRETLAASA